MDYPQRRSQQHSDEPQPSAKVSALPLFAPEPNTKRTISSRMGSSFSVAQWQELELQALIYKYMMAGASVPLELILPLKRNLVSSSLYSHYQHFQTSMVQAGYWGRCLVDPEPRRCRRTDGKKWRCSREVVAGQKYCERHVHRGRNRSRKHVEIPTSTSSSSFTAAAAPLSALGEKKETHFTLSGPSPTLDILPLNQRPSNGKTRDGYLPQGCCSNFCTQQLQGERTDSRVLMRFLDDWPRSKQERTSSNNSASSAASAQLPSSIPENSPSEFSLKLSTGDTNNPGLGSEKDSADGQMQPVLANWSGWENHGEASMGGPLAKALRSSTATPSPTSILQKPSASVSETSSASTWTSWLLKFVSGFLSL